MNELRMIQRIDAAKLKVSQILDRTKNPILPSSREHTYNDKFLLSEFLVNTTLASQLTTLRHLGLSAEHLATVHDWATASDDTVTLRFGAEEKCSFLRTETREEDSKQKTVVQGGIFAAPLTHKVVTTVKEWVWEFEASWEVLVFKGAGADPSHLIRLSGRKGKHCLRTTTDRSPSPELRAPAALFDLDMTFLLTSTKRPAAATADSAAVVAAPSFCIDRTTEACLTPRRNPNVDQALLWATQLQNWALRVKQYMASLMDRLDSATKSALDVAGAQNTTAVFVPVLPLFLEEEQAASGASGCAGGALAVSPQSSSSSSSSSSGGMEGGGDGGEEDYASLPLAIDESPSPSSSLVHASVLLGPGDINSFLAEEERGLLEKQAALAASFPAPTSTSSTTTLGGGGSGGGAVLVSASEAWTCALCVHLGQVCEALADGAAYVETMLRSQLSAAIGHEVTPADFGAYMAFHYRKHLFQPWCAPKPFCHSVRRTPRHSPEGTVSIEFNPGAAGSGGGGGGGHSGGSAVPIETMSCLQPGLKGPTPQSSPQLMGFCLNSATRVNFSGETHLHAWLRFDFNGDDGTASSPQRGQHQGQGQGGPSLVCRARQFSSFVVLVGRLVDGKTLDPTAAFVVQNRDELSVPLELSTLPTPKAFRDAVASLSPEQQRFARAFRQLQLNSTLFAVCVVQVKPQLERVLNLPPDSLAKEIKLAQDLMELFVDFQISADLLSYDDATDAGGGGGGGADGSGGGGSGAVSVSEKLSAVKDHVKAIKDMIDEAKSEEVSARQQEHAFEHPGQFEARMQSQTSDMLDVNMDGFSGDDPPRGGCQRRGGGGCGRLMKKGGGGGGKGGGGASPPPPPVSMAMASAPVMRRQSAGPSAPAPTAAAPELSMLAAQPHQVRRGLKNSDGGGYKRGLGDTSEDFDLTKVAVEVDARYDALDSSNALRPTVVTCGRTWHKKAQAALLTAASKKPPLQTSLDASGQTAEKAKAFDLLDALSRSGALTLEHSELHVVLCATQAFDESVVDTVVSKNVNPIERAERSALIMAAAVHGKPAVGPEGYSALVKPESLARVTDLSPLLFGGEPPQALGRSPSDLLLG